jgi:hypothetical protein
MNRFLADTRHNLKWPQPKGLMLGMNQKITGKVSKRIPIKANNLNVLVYTQDINTTNMHMYHKATPCLRNIVYVQDEMFEETKVVIRIRKTKKDRQYNVRKKKDKRTNNDLQNIHLKLKIE